MKRVGVVGGGPAGLFAAQLLLDHPDRAELEVTVHDQMRVGARKFLLAGRSGLNLTHHEPLDSFAARYGESADWVRPHLEKFTPADLRAWASDLGEPTFVGSTNRVFPESMHATPLLRALLDRLRDRGVRFERSAFRSLRSVGSQVEVSAAIPGGSATTSYTYDAVMLAMGGASWPRLGSDGTWADALAAHDIRVNPFAASNCGVRVSWSPVMLSRFAGAAVKNVRVSLSKHSDRDAAPSELRGELRGELTVTKRGLEGGPIYALGPALREAFASLVNPTLTIDLHPDLSVRALTSRLSAKGGVSLANRLRRAGVSPVGQALLREFVHPLPANDSEALATQIKGVRLPLEGLAGLDRAISSTGGVDREELTDALMLRKLPGVFCAGEMIDWDAPTGGYLLQACFSTAYSAAHGVLRFLEPNDRPEP